MDRTIDLIGSEQVRAASFAMQDAAKEMLRAADTIASENARQRQFLDDWLQRLAGVFEDHITITRAGEEP